MSDLRINVWMNNRDALGRHVPGRHPLYTKLVKSNIRTVLVRLPSGRVIKRKRKRDLV